jgi:RNA polymerase sigma-70 factor, ECF subfamily
MHPSGLATLAPAQIVMLRNGLRIMALRALGDPDAAEDAVQESLLRALKAVTPELASDPTRLGAFVGGIARHVISDMRRQAARAATLSDLYPDHRSVDPLDHVVTAEERAEVRNAFAHLTAAEQTILRASFFDGMTPAQIAAQEAQPSEVVRKRKSRALARLRSILTTMRHVSSPSASNDETWTPAEAKGEL